jgi:hypothetical protein
MICRTEVCALRKDVLWVHQGQLVCGTFANNNIYICACNECLSITVRNAKAQGIYYNSARNYSKMEFNAPVVV